MEEEVLARLPVQLQLDWCLGGFAGVPWFVGGPDVRRIRISAEGPIEAVEAVDPVSLVALAAWVSQRASEGGHTILDESAKSYQAYRAGLLRALAGKAHEIGQPAATIRRSGSPDSIRLLPVTRIPRAELIQPLLQQARPLLHLDSETAQAVLYCLAELLRNVFEHSGSPLGAFVAARHHPQKRLVTIAIADLGSTVPVHFRKKHGPTLDDESALRAALEPRASGSFDMDRNAGLGLYKTRRIADMTGGKFWMMTGGLCARQDGDVTIGGHADVALTRVHNPWKGTIVALTLKSDNISSFNRTSRMINEQLTGGPFAWRLVFSRKKPLDDSVVIEIAPDAGNMAQDKLAAERMRREQVLPVLREGKTVTLSFRGIALTTQSFIHALLAEPLRELGPEQAPRRIGYSWCSEQVREVIQLVAGYVLEEEAMREDGAAPLVIGPR